jgi:hypothetical protein
VGDRLRLHFWSLPLLVYAFNGAQMRLTGDDYCYSGVLSRYGFWQGQVESYTRLNLFNGNRYALTFFSLLAALFGPQANAWLPGLALLMWVASLSSAIYLGARALRLQRMHLEALYLALSAIGLSLAQTPGLEQSLYWRSAMLAYLAPLVSAQPVGWPDRLVHPAGKIKCSSPGGHLPAVCAGRRLF